MIGFSRKTAGRRTALLVLTRRMSGVQVPPRPPENPQVKRQNADKARLFMVLFLLSIVGAAGSAYWRKSQS